MQRKSSVDPELHERIAKLEADMLWVKGMHFIEIVMLVVVLLKILKAVG